jgi:hypothetical protein
VEKNYGRRRGSSGEPGNRRCGRKKQRRSQPGTRWCDRRLDEISGDAREAAARARMRQKHRGCCQPRRGCSRRRPERLLATARIYGGTRRSSISIWARMREWGAVSLSKLWRPRSYSLRPRGPSDGHRAVKQSDFAGSQIEVDSRIKKLRKINLQILSHLFPIGGSII